MNNSGAELTLTLAGGLDDWSNQSPDVVTNAVCALFLMSRAPPLARERLKEGGKVTQFLANLSKRGTEMHKKVNEFWHAYALRMVSTFCVCLLLPWCKLLTA